MQKLFSMFPRGAPGFAILLLRVFLALELASDAVAMPSALNPLVACALVGCALAVLVGVLTPVVATAATLIEALGLALHLPQASLHAFSPAVIGITLAFLGPGAYAIDARIFGRHLLQFSPSADEES